MKVVSLLGSAFAESCRLLAQKISKDYNGSAEISGW